MPRALAVALIVSLVLSPRSIVPTAHAAAGFACFAVANWSGGYGGDDLLTVVDPANFDPATNESNAGYGTGTFEIAAAAVQPATGTLFAVDGYHLGTLDPTTGLFTPAPLAIGNGTGSLGRQQFDSVPGLAFEPVSGMLYASVRKDGADLLIQLDPATGAAIKGPFGSHDKEYVAIQAVGSLADITDIAFDPADGQMYGIATDDAGNSRLVKIDRSTGATSDIGATGAGATDPDIQGLSFASDGRLFGVTGSYNSALYEIDKSTGAATSPRTLDNGHGYRALACPGGPANVISGRVFWDVDANGRFTAGDIGTPDVQVRLYRNRDNDRVATRKDELMATQVTGANGDYTFSVAAQGAFEVSINTKGLPHKHTLTTNGTDAVQLTGQGQIDASNDFGHAEQAFVTDQIVMRFVAGTPQSTIDQILSMRGMQVLQYIAPLDTYLCSTPAGQTSKILDTLNGQPAVVYAEHNYIIEGLLHPSDPIYNDPTKVYAPQQIGAEAAWDTTTGSPSVIVGVLDSGIAWSHPEFSGRIVPGKNFITGVEDATTPNATQDDQGHGTHVAGIIAAAIDNAGTVGIAPGVSIMPVKVLNASNVGTSSNIAAGIVWAVDHGAQVLNLSLAMGTDAQVLHDAVIYAAAHGVFMAAAAGNAGGGIPFYPAAYVETVAVGATNRTDGAYALSNSADFVDVAAPGEDIWSTYRTSAAPNTYQTLTGTSMATPHVAGLAALLLSYKATLTAADLRALIESTAVDMGSPGWDPNFGYGRIDAAAAMAAAASWPPATPTPTPTATATATPLNSPTPPATPTPTLTPTATPVPYAVRVNPGGTGYTDTGGSVWAADKVFATGSWGYTAGTAKSVTTAVNGTLDDPLYQKYRDTPAEYRFTLPNGAYQVTLRLAEFSATAANTRVFKVTIEGVDVETALDVYKLAGKANALDKTYAVNVSDGILNIVLAKNGGKAGYNPVVSGIAVLPASRLRRRSRPHPRSRPAARR